MARKVKWTEIAWSDLVEVFVTTLPRILTNMQRGLLARCAMQLSIYPIELHFLKPQPLPQGIS